LTPSFAAVPLDGVPRTVDLLIAPLDGTAAIVAVQPNAQRGEHDAGHHHQHAAEPVGYRHRCCYTTMMATPAATMPPGRSVIRLSISRSAERSRSIATS
jgi:hypothetical protein